jgi:hypothetical protein
MSVITSAFNKIGLMTKAAAQQAENAAVESVVYRYNARRDSYGLAEDRGGQGWSRYEVLSFLADNCDAVALCIEECIAQVTGTPWTIAANDETADDPAEQKGIAVVEDFFSKAGGLGGPGERFAEFIGKTYRDYLVFGCMAVYRRPNKGGTQTYSVEAIDASTIKPLMTPEGWVPVPPAPAYEQYIQGKRVQRKRADGTEISGFGADELHYLRCSPRTSSRFGRSPTERALSAVWQYMGYDGWAMSYLSDGDADHTAYMVPDAWNTPAGIKSFKDLLLTLNETMAKRREPVVLPTGTTKHSARPRQKGEGIQEQTHLLKRIAKAFNLNASVLGFAGDTTYKTGQEEQLRIAQLRSRMPALLMYRELLNDVIGEDLHLGHVGFGWEVDAEDRGLLATMIGKLGPAVFTHNEARRMMGQAPAVGPYVDSLYLVSQVGAITVLGHPKGLEPEAVAEPSGTAAAPEEGLPEAGVTPAETTTTTGKAEPLPPATQGALRRWRRKAVKCLKEGHLDHADFQSADIPGDLHAQITGRLAKATTPEDVQAAFDVEAEESSVAALVDHLESLAAAVREERGSRQGWATAG